MFSYAFSYSALLIFLLHCAQCSRPVSHFSLSCKEFSSSPHFLVFLHFLFSSIFICCWFFWIVKLCGPPGQNNMTPEKQKRGILNRPLGATPDPRENPKRKPNTAELRTPSAGPPTLLHWTVFFLSFLTIFFRFSMFSSINFMSSFCGIIVLSFSLLEKHLELLIIFMFSFGSLCSCFSSCFFHFSMFHSGGHNLKSQISFQFWKREGEGVFLLRQTSNMVFGRRKRAVHHLLQTRTSPLNPSRRQHEFLETDPRGCLPSKSAIVTDQRAFLTSDHVELSS